MDGKHAYRRLPVHDIECNRWIFRHNEIPEDANDASCSKTHVDGCLTALLLVAPPAAWAAKRDLRVYFIDVEGGQSTLFVTPTGQSLLIDTGWPGNEGRDADRILAATKRRRHQQN